MRVRGGTIFLILAAILCVGGIGEPAGAKVHKGKWRTNAAWSYNTKTRKLTITGSGFIEGGGNDCGDNPGWEEWSDEIREVEIKGRPTRLGGIFCWDFRKLITLKMPDTVTEIDPCAFGFNNKLERIVLSKNLKKIGWNAFYTAGVKELVLPNSLIHIGEQAFSGCVNLKKVGLPIHLKKLATHVFSSCENLTQIELPEALQNIGMYALAGTGLRKVTISQNVEQIKKGAFYALSPEDAKLKKVIIKSKKSRKWGKDIFGKANRSLVIEVPKSKQKEYSRALRSKGLPKYVKVVGKKSLD